MDKKKLIGTLIGVILFGALIAGATFAWLTFYSTVNGQFNFGTNTFYYDYLSATEISEVPILISDDAHAVPGSGTDANDLSAGSFTIRRTLHVKNTGTSGGTIWIALRHNTSETIIVNSNATSSLLKFAVCKDTPCSGNFSTAVMGRSTDNLPGIFAARKSSTQPVVGTTTDQLLYTEVLTEQEEHDYYVYFWLDAARITNANIGAEYSGEIYAYGVQNES